MVNEAKVRDYLVNNLSLIEPNLEFKGKEVSLKNKLGAGGRIDILARDQFGIFVIIEIKKSDKTAREAIHELFKYISLFQTEYGLNSDKCRCILLSTEWHELVVPFSKFSRNVGYHVDGYQLTLNENGVPVEKKKVELISEGEEKYIFPIHHVFLFESEKKRKPAITTVRTILNRQRWNAGFSIITEANTNGGMRVSASASKNVRSIAIRRLEKNLENWNVQNYYSLSIEYRGENSAIMYSFAQYLVFYIFNSEEQARAKQKLSDVNSDPNELFEYYEEKEEYLSLESTVEGEILTRVCNDLVGLCDGMEAGKSEVLLKMLSDKWVVQKIDKCGQNISSFLGSDEEIVREITSYAGGNSSIFTSAATPKFRPSWNSISRDVNSSLFYNEFWQIGSSWFLEKVESLSEEATVSFRIYETCNILFALYNLCCRDEFFLPTLEVVAQIPGEPNKTIILTGFIEWDRKTFPDVESIFEGDDYSAVFQREQIYFKVEPVYNFLMMYRHGISYSLTETNLDENGELSINHLSMDGDDDDVVLLPLDEKQFLSFNEFLQQNRDYLHLLCHLGHSYYHFI